jgi:transcriptional regulator with XRE-family HTH domain
MAIQQEQLYQLVGKRINEARKKIPGMTQEQLGRLVSLTRTSITNIEHGKQKLLLHTLCDIADALGVEPAQLLPIQASSPVHAEIEHELPTDLSAAERAFILSGVHRARGGPTSGHPSQAR